MCTYAICIERAGRLGWNLPMIGLGMPVGANTAQKWLVAEIARWGKVVREHQIKPE